jgi:hypothetical protein
METGLRLLMRDGAVRVVFHPRLNAAQYTELLELVDRLSTKRELKEAAGESARRWGVEFEFEDISI